MSTRGTIARLTGLSPVRFQGRYHHWDSYPSGLGRALWSLYHGHFNQNLDALLRVLLDEHPAGWSTINGADFSLSPGFARPRVGIAHTSMTPEFPGKAPTCYCHGDRSEAGWDVTQENASLAGCEWAYAFVPGKEPHYDAMVVLSSYTVAGRKMIGFFGQGDPGAQWLVIAVVALHGSEPDWDRLESSAPLSSLPSGALGMARTPLVVRDDRPATYGVRFSLGELHYVGVDRRPEGASFTCTCSPEESAPCPDCQHAQAVRLYREREIEGAQTRRADGVEYTGGTALVNGVGQACAFVWHVGKASILLPHLKYQDVSGFMRAEDSLSLPLALAILCDFRGDEELALELFRDFDRHLLQPLSTQTCWHLKASEIEQFLQRRPKPL